MFPFVKNPGILGLNARSLLYIKPFNPKKVTALADSKLKTKAYLSARGIPSAKGFGRVETREQLRAFDFSQLPNECVLKPNHGFGGEGIVILNGKDKHGNFLRSGKTPITHDELREHIEDILDGKFSLSGMPDSAFFEQILKPHDCFARFRPVGLPDIRIIVFNLVPTMAMVRIPTADSDGKANLHLGGIGIGIDIASGKTTHAAQFHHRIDTLPHGESPSGHTIPYWNDILLICSKIQYITNIGYLACDITIDETIGPAVLEVNARAGLNVQLANLAPLHARLKRVAGIAVESPEKGVRIGQDLFGAKKVISKEEVKEEKPTLGIHETIHIAVEGKDIAIPCRIASDQERTVFSQHLIEDLVEKRGAERGEKGSYKVKFTLGGKKIQTLVEVGAIEGKDLASIGSRDLQGFLIDPTKKSKEKPTVTSVKANLNAADRTFAQLDKELLLLKHIKPLNLAEEVKRLKEDRQYNPTFTYAEANIDLQEAKKKLKDPLEDTSPLGVLLEKKRKELLKRIALIEARSNGQAFTEASIALFGKPTAQLIRSAESVLKKRIACDLPPPERMMITAEEAAVRFQEVLEQYSLHDWSASVRQKLVADCTVGGHKIYIRADARFTEEHIASLIAHEIETHVLTSENGEHQPYNLLRRGTAGYLDTQEGLAIYNQNAVLSPWSDKRYNAPRGILGSTFSLKHSLSETREYLEEELGIQPEKALTMSIMYKRGLCDTSEPGGFTKSVVYFRGVRAIEKFVKGGGDLQRLYIGKVTLGDLEVIEQLPDLQQPLILPGFLRE